MRIVPRVSTKKKMVCGSSHQDVATCNCTVPCPGYASRENCPPLIVLAVLVSEEEGRGAAVVPLATAV
jgi:hypothetical protein